MARELYSTSLFNDANLVAYWRLENNVNDSKGSNNGTATDIIYPTGRFGLGATYNGSTSKIIIPTVTTGSGNKTLGLWINTSGTKTYESLISIGSTGTGNSIVIGDDGAATGKIRATSFGSTNASYQLPLNQWAFVVGAFSGTTSKLYINGGLVLTTTILGYNITGTNYSAIGDITASTNTSGKIVDDVFIFNRVLSDTEISDLYDMGPSGIFFHNFL